jgi:hypothetical protein
MIEVGPEHRIDPRMETGEDVLERNIGSFMSCSDPTRAYGWWTMCCNANMPMGLYEAWKGIVECSGNAARVNLLLNRASELLDVDSHLPYEGKVVLQNKSARRAYVRLPRWVDRSAVRCFVQEAGTTPQWVKNYLVIDGLSSGDIVTVEFPVVETVEKHTVVDYGHEYTCLYKGNTLVDISPRADRPARTVDRSDDGHEFPVNKGYPLYLRDHYQARVAPTKEQERYVASRLI